jgi:hypothetical protein
MSIPYSPPNVTVSEVVDPSVAPLIAPASLLALVGPASGEIVRTLSVTLTGSFDDPDVVHDAVALPIPNGSKLVAVTKVADAAYNSDTEYDLTDDYTIQDSGEAQSDTVTAATITRVDGGAIPEGTSPDYEHTVAVTFSYIPDDYFSPILLDNMPDIIDRFGAAWTDPDVTDNPAAVNSPLSFAAELAFENGANEVVLQPLFKVDGVNRVKPSAAEEADDANWASTFEALREASDVNIVVPISGQNGDTVLDADQGTILQATQDHIKYMRDEDQEYLIGVFGEQGASQTTIQSHATTISNRHGGTLSQQIVFVNSSQFTRPSRSGGLVVGGQYVAAALGGMIAAFPVYVPLTRKAISGIIEVNDTRTKAGLNEDASNGLLVVQRKDGVVQVRHAITLDTTSTPVRELSVVRAKHRVIESVRQTIDTQIIGQVVADGEAPLVVRSSIIGVLDQLRAERDIVSYTDVQSRTSSIDPTTIEVRFSYAPAFPVNYVNIVFSLDLSGGAVEASTEVS